tara:strand:- start:187 stop:1320 length:1134 start_codon:yes stop_codon:yes gene_type:complete
MEAIEQTWNGTVGFGNRVTATISRNGDLVHKMYLETVGTPTNAEAMNVGNSIINTVELEIGGQKIDKHTGRSMQVFADLEKSNANGCGSTAGDGTNHTLYQMMSCTGENTRATTESTFYVPLNFWFCRNPGLALPLIALQYHEVKVILELGSDGTTNTPSTSGLSDLASADLWVDYIYLDTDERRRFAQVSHEYLIEQLQTQTFTTSAPSTTGVTDNFELNFNHPVKELVWAYQGAGKADIDTAASYLAAAQTSTSKCLILDLCKYQLKLNGHDRFAERKGSYFSRVQVYQHHSGFGGIGLPANESGADGIFVYSFALKPEEHQPSGTCNFSRIDNAQLRATTAQNSLSAALTLHVYAVNYNVLRIMSGMGGLAYSN